MKSGEGSPKGQGVGGGAQGAYAWLAGISAVCHFTGRSFYDFTEADHGA